jgi:hypothetical protein
VRATDDGALPTDTYGWIETAPAALTVLARHDAIDIDRIVERPGGSVLFYGTSCGKGGKLSWIDFATDLLGKCN